jgi:hypothetical protein
MADAAKTKKAIQRFLKNYSPDSINPVVAVPEKIERHPAIAELVRMHGFTSYSNQLLWLCNPDEFTGVAAPWLEQPADTADIYFRTAFGEMYVWDGVFFWQIMPHQSARMRLTEHSHWLVGESLTDNEMSIRTDLPTLVKRAQSQNQPLDSDEMYNFVPALALGGSETKSKIEKVKLREAVDILVQLAPVQKYGL